MAGTGPPYPPLGPNFIGALEIGVSPIGTIPPFNVWSTIIAQYANSPILTSIILSWFEALDCTELWEEFHDQIMNIATATGYGLDVWGRILGVTRNLQIVNAGAGPFFGFEEAGEPGITGFNQGIFFGGGESSTQSLTLDDNGFRTLLFAKAAANICSGSITGINAVMMALFPGQGNAYVTDGQNMTMTYTFAFGLTQEQEAIVFQSGVLPRPSGVSATLIV